MTRPALRTAAPARPVATRRRRAGSIVVAAGVAGSMALLGACTVKSPTQTLVPYQPADGVALSSGSVDARNLLIVTKAKGEAGVLSGSLINLGTQDLKVTFATDSGDGTGKTAGTVDLGPREQTQITGVEVASVAAEPGALTGLIMSTDAGDAVTQVPVLAPNEYYSTLTPTPGETPDGTETGSATTGSAATGTPTGSASTTAG